MCVDFIIIVDALSKPLACTEESLNPLKAEVVKTLVPQEELLLGRCKVLVVSMGDGAEDVVCVIGVKRLQVGPVLKTVMVVHVFYDHGEFILVIVGDCNDTVCRQAGFKEGSMLIKIEHAAVVLLEVCLWTEEVDFC